MAAISVGSVSVSVVPSVRNFAKDLKAKLTPEAAKLGDELGKTMADRINAQLRGVHDAKLGVDNKVANAEIDKTSAKLDEFGHKRVTATARVNTVGQSGLASMNKLMLAGAAAASAFGPATVALGAGVAGAAVALGSAAVGAGAFAAIAIPMFKNITQAQKDYSTAQSKVATTSKAVQVAQQNLNKATTKSGRAAALKQLKTAQDNYNTALKGEKQAAAELTPAEQKLASSLNALKAGWQTMAKSMQPVVATAITPWFNTANEAVKLMPSLVRPAASAIGFLGQQARTVFSEPFWKTFAKDLGGSGKIALQGFGNALINVGNGLAILFTKFKPWIDKIAPAVAGWGAAFLTWSQGYKTSGFQNFMSYVAKQMPAIKAIFADLGKIIPEVGQALRSVPSASLIVLQTALNAIAKIPPNEFRVLATGILAVVAATKAWKIAQTALDFVLDANPIGLVIAAIGALAFAFWHAWTTSKTFRDVVKDIGVVTLEMAIVAAQASKAVTDSFLRMAGSVVNTAARAFGWIPGLGPKLKQAAAWFNGMKGTVDGAFNAMIGKMQGWQGQLLRSQTVSAATTKQITQDFARQAASADRARSSLSWYSDVIRNNGINSNAAHAARNQLVSDMVSAGVRSGVARKDVNAYTTAVRNNGATSNAAKAARARLVSDIVSAQRNATAGKNDVNAYTNAVRNNGASSNAAKAARAKLIRDLENAGVDAKTATRLVNGMTNAVKRIPTHHSTTLTMNGKGSYTINNAPSKLYPNNPVSKYYKASGGYISGPGTATSDSIPARLSNGEYVVKASAVQKYGVPMMSAINEGHFASGGLVGAGSQAVLQGKFPGQFYNAFQSDMTKSLVKAMRDAIQSAQAAAAGGGFGIPGRAAAGSGPIIAIAKRLLAAMGWANQWPAFNYLEMREAGWNPTIVNKSSGAYGIPQALPASKMASAGADWRTNPATQLRWMMGYIKSRYGNPNGAAAHERAYNWYDSGGYLPPGASMVYNGTGRPEPVFTSKQWDAIERGGLNGRPSLVDTLNVNVAQSGATAGDIISAASYELRKVRMSGVYG